MIDYWNQILSDLHGLPTKSGESNLAMLWGSINEDSALVTYLKNFFPEDKDGVVIKETGIWLLKDGDNQEWLGSSADGIIEHNGILKTVIEIKRTFMGGKPIPYKNVCVPITFINDTMINLVKQEDNTDEECLEIKFFKRNDLTSTKQGYTPERHPPKKQKSWKNRDNFRQ